MFRISVVIVTMASAIVPGFIAQSPERMAAPRAAGWLVEGAARAGDIKLDTFLGRRSLWLKNGTHAIRQDARLIDGTIEFDVAPMDGVTTTSSLP